jgi:hypothetical protein
MDPIAKYRQQVESILHEYAKIPYAHGNIDIQTIFDHEHDHYLLMLVGRDGIRRVHGCLVHIDIIDGKLWIQRDGTEYGIARELIEAGIPASQIVLAFRVPEMDTMTELVPA